MQFTTALLALAAIADTAQALCTTSYGSQSVSSVPTVRSSTTTTTTKVLTKTIVPKTTITPAPVTITTTKTQTNSASTSADSTITDTVNSTSTWTTTSWIYSATPSTSTVILTATTASSSVTVPTSAGFTGVGDYLTALGYTYAKKKRNALAYDAPALVGRATTRFPTQVSCTTTVHTTSRTTVTVTGTSTSTVTAPTKTKTIVSVSTVVVGSTQTPAHVTTIATVKTTATYYTTLSGEFLADYTTTTTTVTADVTTVYAACTGTYNLVSSVDGGIITDAHNANGAYSTSDSSAFDCCNHCQSLGADCWTGGWYKGTCWIGQGNGTGICDVNSYNNDFYYCPGCGYDGVSEITVFNSGCGKTLFGGQAG